MLTNRKPHAIADGSVLNVTGFFLQSPFKYFRGSLEIKLSNSPVRRPSLCACLLSHNRFPAPLYVRPSSSFSSNDRLPLYLFSPVTFSSSQILKALPHTGHSAVIGPTASLLIICEFHNVIGRVGSRGSAQSTGEGSAGTPAGSRC